MRRIQPLVLTVFLAVVGFSPLAHAVADRELVAKQAADAWLVYIDEGKYAEALSVAAPELRESITRKDWMTGLNQVRKPLGKVESRRLERLFATVVLPGGIEGDFIIVNFRTKFEGREEPAEEILIMSPAEVVEGQPETWLVTSYYIE